MLDVRDLHVSFRPEEGLVRAVNGVSFALEPGEVLGIVGESGSGKSVTMLAVMGLITDRNASLQGEIVFKGRELSRRSQGEMQAIRGEEMAMIFQDPMTSLNPVYRVGWQIAEQLRAHENLSRAQANARAAELLDAVGIANAAQRARSYPHEFSGGMRQRVMIAMALSCGPDLLIADEPTTSLDVTIQAQILELIKRLRREYHSAVVLVTHDIGVIAEAADRVLVMYAGRIVEQGTTRELFRDPQHPYTWGLLGSAPRLDRPRPRSSRRYPDSLPRCSTCRPGVPLLPAACMPSRAATRRPHRSRRAPHLATWTPVTSRSSRSAACGRLRSRPAEHPPRERGAAGAAAPVRSAAAAGGGAQEVLPGEEGPRARPRPGAGARGRRRQPRGLRREALGVVGESGCGKSTLARCLIRLHTLTAGRVLVEGRDISTLSAGSCARCAARCR